MVTCEDASGNVTTVTVTPSFADDDDTATFQKGDGKGAVSETDDAELIAGSPNDNFSTGGSLNVDGSPHKHVVLKFPNIFGNGPDQIPLGSTIDSATLTVDVFNTGNTVTIYQLIEGWTESEVAWNSRTASLSWTNAGADGTGSHKATAEGTLAGKHPGARE